MRFSFFLIESMYVSLAWRDACAHRREAEADAEAAALNDAYILFIRFFLFISNRKYDFFYDLICENTDVA